MGTAAKRGFWRNENWGGWKWALVTFTGIMLLHGMAILLFTRGFLLTRTELSQYSECNDIAESPCIPPHHQSTYGSCWTKPAVSRLIIIVLDALRFDFVAPSSFFAEKKPWMDKLQVLHELASWNQSSTKIFKAIADPPTTSLQRLKGLTTGGLPTFVDVGNSFGAPAIVEDNLIHQLVQNGKRVVMMGDDTWAQLFPHHFHGRRICVNTFQQLDFAATVSALLGIPFPFGSIGRVNAELFSLAEGTWNQEKSTHGEDQSPSEGNNWMRSYVNVLCINSWQVKKYIDVYSSLSLIGFSEKDLLHVSKLYSKAHELWSITSKNFSDGSEREFAWSPFLKRQLEAYNTFLESVAALARSSWTEFNLKMMGIGFCIMLSSLYLHVFLIWRLDKLGVIQSNSPSYSRISFRLSFACIVVMIRAWSFLSNSFILEEGRVASFLLATTALLQLRFAVIKKMMVLEAFVLCILISFLKISIEIGQLKQAVNSLFLKVDPSRTLGIVDDSRFWVYIAEVVPILALVLVAYFMYKYITSNPTRGVLKYVVFGNMFNYVLIPFHWASNSSLLGEQMLFRGVNANLVPRVAYAVGLLQLLLLTIDQIIVRVRSSTMEESTVPKALALLSTWSSTIIILAGKQGPLVALALVIGGWSIIRLMKLEQNAKNESFGFSHSYALAVTQWSLLAVCMFFSTGHWCAFDGLRYAAAFVGFDEFNLIRQAILLTIDTFGFSHILPIFGLPFLVSCFGPPRENKREFSVILCQVYLMYGLITAITVTFTMLCVTIQRRHLMVWGLFAPKFVFDVVGLLLGDFLILLSAMYYIV
ncbi:Alkaline-phosphatase-like family protein [Striga hermonthica]|uniref:Alkaline-phosphatase-like family protein n=1 Tax=Striga hermonthica TaxID=68872 RepID=A0A9N7R8G6_STRHE|nr:Alkaline-phosphatase-like family protein [Striga hermonthica]